MVSIKNLLEIYHFQSFKVHLQVFLLLKSNNYKSFYTTFKGSNVNEILSYFGHLLNKILYFIMCTQKKLVFKLNSFKMFLV
jgi:hypothetical protein